MWTLPENRPLCRVQEVNKGDAQSNDHDLWEQLKMNEMPLDFAIIDYSMIILL